MARTDTYTAAQAAQLLGVSERRVRQLVNEGKLAGDRGEDGSVRVAQQAVNEERKRRRSKEAAPRVKSAPRRGLTSSMDVEQLADQVANAVGIKLQGQLEITRQAESLIRGELDEERARRVDVETKLATAEARLAAATARIAELEASVQEGTARKGLFRRR